MFIQIIHYTQLTKALNTNQTYWIRENVCIPLNILHENNVFIYGISRLRVAGLRSRLPPFYEHCALWPLLMQIN
jgi:hypothetical protein